MKSRTISIELKEKCAEAYNSGVSARQIYNDIFYPEHQAMSFETFKRKIQYWRDAYNKSNELTLNAGTYPGFVAHAATVQVNSEGVITQAWVKQSADEVNWDVIIEKFQDEITPYRVQKENKSSKLHPMGYKKHMLEIPLFDMHFGVATLKNYSNVLSEIIDVVKDEEWDEINVLFGQDVLHTNDMRGHTAKGTDIGVIDFASAWQDCFEFFTNVLMVALEHSTNVNMHYTKGNHDECAAWCMFKCLETKFPQIYFDDEISPRKCINWNGCFIGYGHCEYKSSKGDLFRDFVVDFPTEFSSSKVREIHCGHLHSESYDNGFMVRRLSSAVPSDKWSKENGFIGSNKRFTLFVWSPNKLNSIIYIGG